MTGATYQIVVVEGFIVFLLNLSPRGCWRAVGTQCEPVCSECEPAHSDSVTECEPGKGDVCKPACGYLRAATARRADAQQRPWEAGDCSAGERAPSSHRREARCCDTAHPYRGHQAHGGTWPHQAGSGHWRLVEPWLPGVLC